MQRRMAPQMFALAIGFAIGSSAYAADDLAASRRPPAHGIATLAKKRQAIADQIAATKASEEKSDDNDSADTSGVGRGRSLALLHSLDAVYAQHQSLLEQREQLEAEQKEVDKQLESLEANGLDESRPYSFLLHESLNDQLAVEEDREKGIKADIKSAKQLLQAARDELNERETAQQRLATLNDQSPHEGEPKSPELVNAELASRLAAARVAFKQVAIDVPTLRQKLSSAKQKLLTNKIAIVAKDAPFSAQDRDKILQQLTSAQIDLKRRRNAAEDRFAQVDAQQKATLKELAEKQSAPKVIQTAEDAWRDAAEASQAEVVILDEQIDNIGNLRQLWKHRYELAANKAEPKQVSRWLAELDEFLEQLGALSQSLAHRRDALRDEQASGPQESSSKPPEGLAKWHELRRASRQELRDLCDATLNDIHAQERTLARFRNELKTQLKKTSGTWGSVSATLKSLVGYKVSDVDDESITLGRLLLLGAYIVSGLVLAYSLTRLIGRKLLPRLGLHRGTAAALKSILFYTLCIVFGVISFQLLHIPLAAFAFLGGAAAIGIGFGSQDIMNNFMSGIILLTEQPIRVGDFIQIGDVQGVVLHIGLRSIRLRTDSNHELIVPNKTLLDDQVTNLTLSDNFVQMFVSVTLDRSMPVSEAKLAMMRIAFSHPKVLKSPRPAVILKEFDSYYGCLTYDIYFSLQMKSFMECTIVRSEILEAITELFPPPAADTDAEKTTTPAESEPALATAATAEAAPEGEIDSADIAPLVKLKKMNPSGLMKQLKRARDALAKESREAAR